MDQFERNEYIRQILDIKFDDDEPYTRAELEDLSDDELKDCHTQETANLPAEETTVILETCAICKSIKACPFEDEDGRGSICEDCAEAFVEEDDADDDDLEDSDDDPDDEDDDEGDED